MKKIYELASQLQSKRDALDDQRDKELKALEPLKKYSLRHNSDAIRRAARANMRSRGIVDVETQSEILELLGGLTDETPDVYEDRCAEVRRQYRDSLTALEKGYRPLFQHEVDRLRQAVERIEVEKDNDLLDAKTLQDIQILSLRKNAVSREVLDGFADKVKGNESALALLDEIAERSTPMDMYGRHLPSHRYRNMLTVEKNKKEQAQDALRQLVAGVSNYLSYHSDRASRVQQQHYNEVHGTRIDTARWKFDDMSTFLHQIEVDTDSVEVLGTLGD